MYEKVAKNYRGVMRVSPPLPRDQVSNPSLQRPDWTQIARNTKGVIPLDKNENTDPEFKKVVLRILRDISVESVLEYPECAPYYHRLSEHLSVKPENLLFTPGSDGAIRLTFETFLSPGDTVILTMPSFAMYPLYTQMYGGLTFSLNYKESESGPMLGVTEICKTITKIRPRLFCIPNPDSPTGTIFEINDLERIIAACDSVGAVALIDEAYYPFTHVSALPLIDDYQNLIITRTFAKAWGIAGLRLGFAVAHPKMAALLHKVRPMYEVNGFALAVMNGLIESFDEVKATVSRINAGQEYFLARMKDLEFRTLACAGNFVHVDFGVVREAVHDQLEGKVLYKKSFSDPCLAGFSRFTTAPKKTMGSIVEMIERAID